MLTSINFRPRESKFFNSMEFKYLKKNLSKILLVECCIVLLAFSCDSKTKESKALEAETKPVIIPREGAGSTEGMVWIEGGEFVMGTDEEDAYPAEKPAVNLKVEGFWMDETEVTNQEYKAFVDATGYVTLAEKKPEWEDLKKQLPP